MLPPVVCVHCGSPLGWIVNVQTIAVSRTTMCPHCDVPHQFAGCRLCARMDKTVRIIPRETPDG